MAVDAGLEQAIDAVESAVDDYRAAQTPDRRAALVAALGQVDELVELGDDFAQRSAAGLVGYGVSPRASATLSAFGARGPSSMAEEVPAAVLRAQIALVRCAKDVVRGTGPNAEVALGAAVEDLARARDPANSVAPVEGPGTPPPSVPPPPAVPPAPGLL